MKKILALVLALVMALGVASAFAERSGEDFTQWLQKPAGHTYQSAADRDTAAVSKIYCRTYLYGGAC